MYFAQLGQHYSCGSLVPLLTVFLFSVIPQEDTVYKAVLYASNGAGLEKVTTSETFRCTFEQTCCYVSQLMVVS